MEARVSGAHQVLSAVRDAGPGDPLGAGVAAGAGVHEAQRAGAAADGETECTECYRQPELGIMAATDSTAEAELRCARRTQENSAFSRR